MMIAHLFLMALILMTPLQIFAGECQDSPENYLNGLAAVDIDKDQRDVFCLYHKVEYYQMAYDHFATQKEINKITKETESSKKLAYELLPKFLKSGSAMNRCSAAEALAYYKWPDSYDYLTDCDNDRPGRKAVIYAILDDKRAIPWIIEQYKIIDNKYLEHPEQSYSQKMTFLNALYHIASTESLSFIEEVIDNPRPEKIRKRALKVKKRILKQGK